MGNNGVLCRLGSLESPPWSVHGGIESSFILVPIIKLWHVHSKIMFLNCITCDFVLHFLIYYILKNAFQYFGSSWLAASHAFVFVRWLFCRGHTRWTWFFSSRHWEMKRLDSTHAGRTVFLSCFHAMMKFRKCLAETCHKLLFMEPGKE